MFSSTGKKIKLLALIYSVIIDALTIIGCIVFWKTLGAEFCVILGAISILSSSIISLVLEGFGTMVQNSTNQLKLEKINCELNLSDHQSYPRFNEYAKEIIKINDEIEDD